MSGPRDFLHSSEHELPPRCYELIALAVALTTQCVYCIDKHVTDARRQRPPTRKSRMRGATSLALCACEMCYLKER